MHYMQYTFRMSRIYCKALPNANVETLEDCFHYQSNIEMFDNSVQWTESNIACFDFERYLDDIQVAKDTCFIFQV